MPVIECANFPTCGGQIRFRVEPFYDGADEWTAFRGYSAEIVEQTCECALTDEEIGGLEDKAIEDALTSEPDWMGD